MPYNDDLVYLASFLVERVPAQIVYYCCDNGSLYFAVEITSCRWHECFGNSAGQTYIHRNQFLCILMARKRPNEGLKILVNTFFSKGKDCYYEDELKFDLINFRRYEIKL